MKDKTDLIKEIENLKKTYSILQKNPNGFSFKKPPIHIAGNCVGLLIQIEGVRNKAKGGKKEPFPPIGNSLRLTVHFLNK
jgi:hypothetical protein